VAQNVSYLLSMCFDCGALQAFLKFKKASLKSNCVFLLDGSSACDFLVIDTVRFFLPLFL